MSKGIVGEVQRETKKVGGFEVRENDIQCTEAFGTPKKSYKRVVEQKHKETQ